MAKAVKPKSEFKVVRMIYGKGDNAKDKYGHIVDGGMNDVIRDWHAKQEAKAFEGATPSSITKCPRTIYFRTHGIKPINVMTWAVSQRLMLGRMLENLFAQQLADEGLLLHHWKDDVAGESERFHWGDGFDHIDGVPDYLLQLKGTEFGDVVVVSDAKTSRSDSFGYVELNAPEIWNDWGWYKYRLQVTAYYMLCHANKEWFIQRGLPLPTHCHLFSYALDDGVVRREILWQPTKADMELVVKYARRFNKAFASETVPDCTCEDSFEQFDMKFCDYGVKAEGDKIATSCCSLDLIP